MRVKKQQHTVVGKQGHFEKAGAKTTEDRQEVVERRIMTATTVTAEILRGLFESDTQ